MLVILDSSMLMLPLEKKLNITFEIERLVQKKLEIVVPQVVLDELKKLLNNEKQSTILKAKLALDLASKFSVLESETGYFADEEILRIAVEKDAIVATNDSELRMKLRARGIAVISLRGKNKLSLFGDIK